MNTLLATSASVLTVVALLLPMQGHVFTRADAGGPRIRMLITGNGSPTVVFDTGGGGSLEGWGRVPSEVSRFTKTIAYDRAGNGLSEKATAPQDGRHVATELHVALHDANAAPPYILVGHSIGGPYMRVFAGMYPDEVVGLVLVDPTQEGMVAWDKEHGFERSVQEECRSNDERSCQSATLAQAHESTIPVNIPVFLIHAMGPRDAPFWSKELEEGRRIQEARAPAKLRFHKEWVDNIPGARLITAENSGHGTINFEEPGLVVRIIREAVEKSRTMKTGSRE